jgi:large subunit ribosomal protein L23
MATNVLIKPIITEKSTRLSEKRDTYAFKVAKDCNKIEIKTIRIIFNFIIFTHC